ncbi:hypothetical protein ES708_14080 [subsurface metagenome]
MTVNNIEENGQIYCQWFVGNESREDYFSHNEIPPFYFLKDIL